MPPANDWLKSAIERLFPHLSSYWRDAVHGAVVVAALVGAIATAVETIGNVKKPFIWIQDTLGIPPVATMCLFEATIIAGAVFLLFAGTQPAPATDETDLRAQASEDQLWRGWKLLWLLWLVVYPVLALTNISHYSQSPLLMQRWLAFGSEFLNNVSTLVFLSLYCIMVADTVTPKDIEAARRRAGLQCPRDPSQHSILIPRSAILVLWSVMFICLYVVQLWAILHYAPLPAKGNEDLNFESVDLVFGLLYGALAGAAMAFFFGRLGTLLFNIPRGWIALFYGYAAMQPAFVLLAYAPKIQIAEVATRVFILALLFCKLALFVVMRRLLVERQLLFYMKGTPVIFKRVTKAHAKFLNKHPPLPFTLFGKTILEASPRRP